VHEETVTDILLQVHSMVKSRSVTSAPTVNTQKEIYALQDPDVSTVYHIFHGPISTTTQIERSITGCEGVTLTWFQNRDNCYFSTGSWD
jgi:hypothetical protein